MSSAVKKPEALTPSAGGKRKAEGDLRTSSDKISKTSNVSNTKLSTDDTGPAKFQQPLKPKAGEAQQSLKPKVKESPSAYKGTGRQESSTPSQAASKNAAPKKNSYAEIMVRGNQNQRPPIGSITHKPKERISAKKEMALEKELAKKNPLRNLNGKSGPTNKTSELAVRKAHPNGKGGERAMKSGVYQGTSRPLGKSQQLPGYQGTAKSKPQASYQGTMRGSKPTVSSKRAYHSDSEPTRSKLQSSSKHHRKEEDYDDESEGYGSEDQYTYASEDYSDMDAGFEDMEEEDEKAARLARQEDAREQAELERLKREKEKKKPLPVQGKNKGR